MGFVRKVQPQREDLDRDSFHEIQNSHELRMKEMNLNGTSGL